MAGPLATLITTDRAWTCIIPLASLTKCFALFQIKQIGTHAKHFTFSWSQIEFIGTETRTLKMARMMQFKLRSTLAMGPTIFVKRFRRSALSVLDAAEVSQRLRKPPPPPPPDGRNLPPIRRMSQMETASILSLLAISL